MSKQTERLENYQVPIYEETTTIAFELLKLSRRVDTLEKRQEKCVKDDLKQQIEYALTREEVPTQEILRILRDMLELIETEVVTCCGIEITD